MRLRPLLLLAALCLSILSGCTALVHLRSAPLLARAVPQDYSGVLALRRDRHAPLVVHARGLALREERQPVTQDTRFLVGSMTQWISAVTVLRLADMGRLDLDAPIARHLPELPAARGALTLRQLMTMRGAIPNGLDESLRQNQALERLEIGPVEAALRFGSAAPASRPGESADPYINWVLVAAVAERALRTPFTETVEELVLAPSGVRDTGFATTGYEDEVGMAVAYSAAGQRKTPAVPPMLAAGGTLYSTARDLVAIADTVYATHFLSSKARGELAAMTLATRASRLGGIPSTIPDKAGASLAWVAGAFGGYASLLAYDPADGRTVLLLNNTDMAQAEMAKIAAALLAGI